MDIKLFEFLIDNKDIIRTMLLPNVELALVSYESIKDNILFKEFIVYNVQELMVGSISGMDKSFILENVTEDCIRLVVPEMLDKDYWRKND